MSSASTGLPSRCRSQPRSSPSWADHAESRQGRFMVGHDLTRTCRRRLARSGTGRGRRGAPCATLACRRVRGRDSTVQYRTAYSTKAADQQRPETTTVAQIVSGHHEAAEDPDHRGERDQHVARHFVAVRYQQSPSVSARGARHHADRHAADGPDRQRVDREQVAYQSERGKCAQHEVDDDPAVGQVEHPDQRRPEACATAARGKVARRGRPAAISASTAMTAGGACTTSAPSNASTPPSASFSTDRMPRGLNAGNAVAGEHRDHPPAHHGQDEQHDVETDLQTRPLGPGSTPRCERWNASTATPSSNSSAMKK